MIPTVLPSVMLHMHSRRWCNGEIKDHIPMAACYQCPEAGSTSQLIGAPTAGVNRALGATGSIFGMMGSNHKYNNFVAYFLFYCIIK